jgi:hypothetical protein
VGKILKAVRRLGKKEGGASQETLMLAVLLVRTQLPNLEPGQALSLLLTFEPAVNALLNEAKDRSGGGGDETAVQELADSLLYTLGLLMLQKWPGLNYHNSNHHKDGAGFLLGLGQEDVKALGMAQAILREVAPLTDSTVYFIADQACKLARACAGPSADNVAETIAEAGKHLTKILAIVERLYPNEYQQVCAAAATAAGEVDLFFLGGNSSAVSRPTEAVVAAKRALLDSHLIRYLAEQPLGLIPKLSNKKLVKLLKESQRDVDSVLAVDTEFLIDQLPAGQLETLLVNLVRLLPLLESRQLLRHICSPQLMTRLQHRRRLELLLLPLFVQPDAAAASQQLLAGSGLVQTSSLLAPLLSVSPDHPNRFAAIMAKVRLGLDSQLMADLVHDQVVINSPELVSLLLAVLLSKEGEGGGGGQDAVGPVVQLCTHVLLQLPVSDKFEDLADVQNHVSMAKLSGKRHVHNWEFFKEPF